MSMPLISIRGLGVTLGATRILDSISLDVAAGTIHALVGPNGAGKTTLLRAVLGELPHEGEIRIALPPRGRLAHVPQTVVIDPNLPMTVADFLGLMLGRRPLLFGHGRGAHDRFRSVLERTSSAHLLERPMTALSGGEMRRVLLAQALEPMPALLLLDEPTSQVDEVGLRLFEELALELRSAVTILMVGHDLASIARIADRVTVINRSVVHDGRARDLADPRLVAELFRAGAIEPPTPVAA